MDPLSNMLTQIRNAQLVGHKTCSVRFSKIKENVLKILKESGYIKDYRAEERLGKKSIKIVLSYEKGDKPTINHIRRVSKPGRRIYLPSDKIPYVLRGIGMLVISTSKGVMNDKDARKEGIGGEVICEIW